MRRDAEGQRRRGKARKGGQDVQRVPALRGCSKIPAMMLLDA